MSGNLVAWIIAGAVVGGIWHGLEGALACALLGFFAAIIIELRGRIDRLERDVRDGKATPQKIPVFESRAHVVVSAPDLPAPHSNVCQVEDTCEQASAPDMVPLPLPDTERKSVWQTESARPSSAEPDLAQKIIQIFKYMLFY